MRLASYEVSILMHCHMIDRQTVIIYLGYVIYDNNLLCTNYFREVLVFPTIFGELSRFLHSEHQYV